MSASTQIAIDWSEVVNEIEGQVSAEDFSTWFNGLDLLDASESQVILHTANPFAAIWLTDNFLGVIERAVEAVTGQSRLVKVVETEETAQPPAPSRLGDTTPSQNEQEPAFGQPTGRRQSQSPFVRTGKSLGNVHTDKTFDSFVVGQDNQFAHAACEAVANNPAELYNPLFLYGDTGLGKTHLMHAIAHHTHSKHPDLRIKYVSSEKFTNEFIHTIQEGTFKQFREKYRKLDVLLIDDIHFLANKERIQEEFFHTFNDLYESSKQVVLSSDRPANEIAKLESRLVSRFQMGLSVDIQPPDLETRLAILNTKAEALDVNIEPELLEFLAKRVTRNIRRMEGALTRVASFAKLGRRSLDLQAIERLLQDILQEEARHTVSIDQIQKKVADHFHLTIKDLVGRRRPANIAFARQVAMYLGRKLTNHSLVEVGEAFGGRDHGTVCHACKTVENRIELEPDVRTKLDALENQLSHSLPS